MNLPEARSEAEFCRQRMRAPPLDLKYHLPIRVRPANAQVVFLKIRDGGDSATRIACWKNEIDEALALRVCQALAEPGQHLGAVLVNASGGMS